MPQKAETEVRSLVLPVERRADGEDAAIVLKDGQSWPSIKAGSRITLTVVAGLDPVPPDIVHAMLLLVAFWFKDREAVNVGNIVNEYPFGVDALLCNHRRYS